MGFATQINMLHWVTNLETQLMKSLTEYPVEELKLIYHLLHTQMPQHTQLIGSDLLQDLQDYLLQQARDDGVDVAVHKQWNSWLQPSEQ